MSHPAHWHRLKLWRRQQAFIRRTTSRLSDRSFRDAARRDLDRVFREQNRNGILLNPDPRLPLLIRPRDIEEARLLTLLQRLSGFCYMDDLAFSHGLERILIADHQKSGRRLNPKRVPPKAPMHIEYIDDTVGFGVFADRTLRPGEFLGEYAGVVRYKNEMPNGLYGYTYPPLDDGRSPVLLSIDATLRGNICRFINHTTDEPIHHDYDFFNGHWHVTFHVLRPIREGEQLLIDYGAGYWEDKAVPPLELLPRMNEDPSMTSCLSTMSCRPV